MRSEGPSRRGQRPRPEDELLAALGVLGHRIDEMSRRIDRKHDQKPEDHEEEVGDGAEKHKRRPGSRRGSKTEASAGR